MTEWIFKVFDEDGGGTIDIDELIKIVIGLFNMNGEILDREVILACVIELLDIIDEDGNGEITRDEFIQNGMKSGFIRNGCYRRKVPVMQIHFLVIFQFRGKLQNH